MIGVIVLELKYKRILLKLSGEALAGEKGMGIDFDVATKICESIKKWWKALYGYHEWKLC